MNAGFRPLASTIADAPRKIPLPPLTLHPAGTDPFGARRRSRIWDLNPQLHCSVIGTCLSTGELRQVLTRAGMHQARPHAASRSDHELHSDGVRLATRHDAIGKILNKALDERHRATIRRAASADSIAALEEFWRDAVRQGDIPGGYWALLTHPLVTEALVRTAFGEVHMLSHLVGSANRADLRRLCQLEAEKNALIDKLARQQNQLRDAILSRDATIAELRQALLTRLAGHHPPTAEPDDQTSALAACAADLERRLATAQRRQEGLERRLEQARRDLSRQDTLRAAAEQAHTQLAAELHAVEAALLATTATQPPSPDLDGINVLYVGARPNQVPGLRALAERRGANLLHHDGGIEDSTTLLPGLIARADLVLFPVDCISHDAALTVKRICRQQARPFTPLRAASASSLLAALTSLAPVIAGG